jgi:hypothetical protein
MLPIEQLQERANANARLVHRGRFVDTRFLLAVGDDNFLIHVHGGRIEKIEKGPFVMPRWTFALRASREDWEQFWQPLPKPGFHDLMALVKFRRLRVEGDQHPFMANLLYFKGVMESLRTVEGAAA